MSGIYIWSGLPADTNLLNIIATFIAEALKSHYLFSRNKVIMGILELHCIRSANVFHPDFPNPSVDLYSILLRLYYTFSHNTL